MRVMQLKHKAVPVTNSLLCLAGIQLAIAAAAVVQGASIFTQSGMRLFCLIGSIIGAFMAVGLWKSASQSGGPRALAVKFLCSMFGGVLFTPLFFRFSGWVIAEDMVMAVAGIIAFVTVGTIGKAIPVYERWVEGRIEAKARSMGMEPNQPQQSPPK